MPSQSSGTPYCGVGHTGNSRFYTPIAGTRLVGDLIPNEPRFDLMAPGASVQISLRRIWRLLGSFSVLLFLQCLPAIAAEPATLAESDGAQREVRHWTQEAQRHLATGNPGAAAEALAHRANLLLGLGHRPAALADLEAAYGLAAKQGERRIVMIVASALGKAQVLAGAPQKARPRLQEALAIAREDGPPRMVAAILNDMGNLYSIEQKNDDAVSAYNESRALSLRSGDRTLASKASRNSARVLLRKGERVGATARALEALQDLTEITDSPDKAFGLVDAAQLLRRLRGTGAPAARVALESLQAAITISERADDKRLLSYALGNLGLLYEEENRLEEALELTYRAIFAAQQAQAQESLYMWQWQSGRILARLRSDEDALAAYRHAIYTLQPIRADVILDLRGSLSSYRDAIGPLYLEFADLLLQRSSAQRDLAQRQRYLIEARNTIEQFKAVELEDYFQDECVASMQSKQTDIDRVAPKTAIVYPIILPGRVELLLSLPAGMRQVTLPVTGRELSAEIVQFRRLLEKRTTHEYLRHAQRLYDWVIRPIQSDLATNEVDTLVLVPDGPLRSIPLASLHDGENFLVAHYAVATAPGLTLIEPQAIARQSFKLLLNGLTESVQHFPALPNVAAEMEMVQSMYGGTFLQNRDFVIANLEKALENVPYSVVHIASHGQFDSDPRKSFLLTFDDKLTMDGLERMMKMSRYRESPVELLTLSACRTATGDDRAALGLAGVAIKAGVRSALATLWYINDQASSVLVGEFYRHLADPTLSKAKSLQLAQQKILADPRYRHPGYWAPFLLIGNWL